MYGVPRSQFLLDKRLVNNKLQAPKSVSFIYLQSENDNSKFSSVEDYN
jgi:hypothetical protein